MKTPDQFPSSVALYVLGDGDDVRQRIERRLLDGDVLGCAEISRSIAAGMEHMKSMVGSRQGWELVFCGGDDILIKVLPDFYDESFVKFLMTEFSSRAGSTISFGMGSTMQRAYLGLRRAKAHGGGFAIHERD